MSCFYSLCICLRAAFFRYIGVHSQYLCSIKPFFFNTILIYSSLQTFTFQPNPTFPLPSESGWTSPLVAHRVIATVSASRTGRNKIMLWKYINFSGRNNALAFDKFVKGLLDPVSYAFDSVPMKWSKYEVKKKKLWFCHCSDCSLIKLALSI